MASPPAPPAADPLPELHIRLALTDRERIAALRLITDSLAQQRQTLNRSIIFHPYTLAAVTALYGILFQLNFAKSDLGLFMLLAFGISIALLSLLQRWTAGMLDHAEELGKTEVLERELEGEGRECVVAVWDERVIGTVVVREGEGGKKGEKKGVEVWAWTVERRYRGNGMGRDLLRSAVKLASSRGCAIRFADEHANSFRLQNIPKTFNKRLDAADERARKTLQALIAEEK